VEGCSCEEVSGHVMGLDAHRIHAFWVELAEFWVTAADHSQTHRGRLEALERVRVCLSRAKLIREQIETQCDQGGNQESSDSAATIVS